MKMSVNVNYTPSDLSSELDNKLFKQTVSNGRYGSGMVFLKRLGALWELKERKILLVLAILF